MLILGGQPIRSFMIQITTTFPSPLSLSSSYSLVLTTEWVPWTQQLTSTSVIFTVHLFSMTHLLIFFRPSWTHHSLCVTTLFMIAIPTPIFPVSQLYYFSLAMITSAIQYILFIYFVHYVFPVEEKLDSVIFLLFSCFKIPT